MAERIFAQRWADEGRRFPYYEAGSGETIVAIVDEGSPPTRAHVLLAERRRVIAFAITPDMGSPQEAACRIGAVLGALGIARFDRWARVRGLRPQYGWRWHPRRRSVPSCSQRPTARPMKSSAR